MPNAKTPTKKTNAEFGIDFASQLSTAQKLTTRKSSVIPDRNVELTDRIETLEGTGPSFALSLTSHALEQIAMAPATASQVPRHPDAKTMHQNTSTVSAQTSSQASEEACLNNLDLLSIKDPSKKQTLQAAAGASSSSGLCGT